MKLFYLLCKSSSKHFRSEIVLMIQIFASIVLINASIIPFVKHWQINYHIADGLPENSVYYSVPTFTSSSDGVEYDFISSLLSNSQIKSVCLTYQTTGYVNGEKSDIYLYNKAMFDYLESPLKSGDWYYDSSIVYINDTIYRHLGGNESIDVLVDDGIFKIEGSFNSAGIINKTDIVYDIKRAGTDAELSTICSDYSNIRHLVPSHTDLLIIIPFEFGTQTSAYSMMNGAILELHDGIDPAIFIVDHNTSDTSGSMFSKNDLQKNSLNRLLDAYRFDALISILLAISTLFGIGGYTYLKLQNLKKQMGIYCFCGCSPKLFSLLTLLSNIIILIIPVTFAYFTRNYIILSEGYDSLYSFGIAATFTILVFLIPLLLTNYSAKKLSFVELLYHDA